MTFPAGLTLVTVTGRLISPSTSVLPRVTFSCPVELIGPTDNAIVLPFVREAVVLSDGSFVIELPATDDPQWAPEFQYIARISAAGKASSYVLDVPYDEPTFDIADRLTPGTPPAPQASYMLLALRGAAGGVASLDVDGLVPADQLPPSAGGDPTWASITGKPSVFPPDAHTQAISTITGLQAALDGKSATGHTHTIANVTGLQTALDGKQASGDYATGSELDDVAARVTVVEGMTPVIRSWNGSAYVEDADGLIYVGPGDPGAAPDGSVWIDTTP